VFVSGKLSTKILSVKSFITLGPGPNAIKNFTFVIYEYSFVTGEPFQPSLMFVRKGGAYPSGAHKRSGALPTNIRLSWKGLPGKNSSLLRTFVNYGRKKFCNIGPWRQFIKYFFHFDTDSTAK
jgi:hypothetical protein